MKLKRSRYTCIGLLLILTSCDFLGIGGNHPDNTPDTPSLAWQHELPSNSGVTAPVIENGSVYVLGIALARFDLQTGDENWQTFPRVSSNSKPSRGGSLLLVEDAVIVGQSARVQSFAKTDGQLLWETSIHVITSQDDSLTTADLPLAQTTALVFAGSPNQLTGLNKSNGEIELDIGLDAFASEGATQQVSSLIATNSIVFAATHYNTDNTFQPRGNLIAINAETGAPLWATNINAIINDSTSASVVAVDLALSGDLLVVLTTNEVVALTQNTGDIVWQTPLGDNSTLLQSNILAEGDAIFVNTSDGKALRLSSADGTAVWQTSVTENDAVGINNGRLVLSDGKLYDPLLSLSNSGIRVLDAKNGTIEQIIRGSNIENVNIDFDFFGGIAVSDQILVRQSAINTYGIKL